MRISSEMNAFPSARLTTARYDTNPDLNGRAQRIRTFEQWATVKGDPRASNLKAALGTYFDYAFHDDAASFEGLQTTTASLELVEDRLEIVEGCVQVPQWYLTTTNGKKLANLLRAVVRLQYREYERPPTLTLCGGC